jgi:hypothetical protein
MKLIVGVDPGTTVGFAVLDLDGKVIKIGSEKELSLDRLVSKITKLGTVIIVGCDKAKIPSFVQDFATKFHAKIISPKSDTAVVEKRSLTEKYKHSNAHEMDALSSAIFAFKKVQALLRKIKANIPELDMFEDIADLVIREQVSIHAALEILSPELTIEKESQPKEIERDSDIVHIYAALKNSRREINALRRQNHQISLQKTDLENKYKSLRKKSSALVKPKPLKQIAAEKERRLYLLSKNIEAQETKINTLEKTITNFESLMLNFDKFIAIKRLRRLSGPNLPTDEIIYIDDPNEFSNTFISKLKANIVIFDKPPSKNVKQKLRFAFIDSKDVIVKKLNSIVIIDKEKLDKARSSREVLEKVITEYRKTRAS